ncbi:MAG: hypothetical protein IPI43_29720 [Sandaracinaceae bacterium]|nr:hypothetical protein [Sandaracinaceae bacterium]
MELRLSEKQGAELRILAPDEPEARANFEARTLDWCWTAPSFLKGLVPSPELFDLYDERTDDDDGDASDEDEDAAEARRDDA